MSSSKKKLSGLEKSPIKYFEAVLSLTDELLGTLQEFEIAQAEIIAESHKIALKLNAKYIDNPNLTEEENKLLAERQKFLAKYLDLAIDEPKRKILLVKTQAENFFKRLDKINVGNNSIIELAAIQAEPRADFEFLAENLARVITEAQKKIEFFTAHKDLIVSIIELQSAWNESYKVFKIDLRDELFASCHEDGVDDEIFATYYDNLPKNVDEKIFATWYDDWQKKRFAIEKNFCRWSNTCLKEISLIMLMMRLKFWAIIVILSINSILTTEKIFIRNLNCKTAAKFKRNLRLKANFIN